MIFFHKTTALLRFRESAIWDSAKWEDTLRSNALYVCHNCVCTYM